MFNFYVLGLSEIYKHTLLIYFREVEEAAAILNHSLRVTLQLALGVVKLRDCGSTPVFMTSFR